MQKELYKYVAGVIQTSSRRVLRSSSSCTNMCGRSSCSHHSIASSGNLRDTNRQQVAVLRQLTPVLQCNYRSVPSAHDTQWSLAEIYFGAKTQFIVTEAVFGVVYELRGVLDLPGEQIVVFLSVPHFDVLSGSRLACAGPSPEGRPPALWLNQQ